MIGVIILIFGLVFGALATANVPSPPRFNWLGAAITCIVLYMLLGVIPLH